ncbi:MAG: TetR/AcrR family transcriptional regulator [Treponema sp.]|nr:TetR/AcrR family transcriptional regulator [Treponema sp.]MBQ5383586.1 TetR/AcrR family transcriptional regulator [Treponema sp.]
MAIIVEHEKRKHEILGKSLDLFIEEGYENVTFQKIADRCGITRTTLYIYFKNKQEIFVSSIKELTDKLEAQLKEIIFKPNLSASDCLKKFVCHILDQCENFKKFFKVLLVYLIQIQKTGVDAGKRVDRRVLRLRHMLNIIIIRGKETGEFTDVPIKQTTDILYTLLESGVFRLAVEGRKDIDDTRRMVNLMVDSICVKKD